MLSYIRNGWAWQVFSASEERFSLRCLHVFVSWVFSSTRSLLVSLFVCILYLSFACLCLGTSGRSGCTDGSNPVGAVFKFATVVASAVRAVGFVLARVAQL